MKTVAIEETTHTEFLFTDDAEQFLADLAAMERLPEYALRELGITAGDVAKYSN